MRIDQFVLGLSVTTMLLAGIPVMAHHSDAGFDGSKTVSVKGTLKIFSWSAPHAQLIVMHTNDKGDEEELGISTTTPALLLRQGLSPKDFRRGDKVEVFYHPTRDGSPSGYLVKLVGADGKTLLGAGLQP